MPFDLQPNLKGELIRLRPLKPEDWDDLFAVASDALIWEQHPESDRYKEDVFRIFFQDALESGGAFVVIDNDNQHHRVDAILRLRSGKIGDRDWMDISGAKVLGRTSQPRNETTNAGARVQVC